MQPLRRILSRQLILIQLPLMGLLLLGVWVGTRSLLLDRAVREGRTALHIARDTLGRRLTAVERAGHFTSEWWLQGRLQLADPESVGALLMPWLDVQSDLLVLNLVDELGRSLLFIRDDQAWKVREIVLDPQGGRRMRWRRCGPKGLHPPDHVMGNPGPYDARLRPWYQETRTLSEPRWSLPYNYDPPESKHVITWLVPLAPVGGVSGALGLDIPARNLDRMVEALLPTAGSAFWILDGAGGVLAASSVAKGHPQVPLLNGRRVLRGKAHQVLRLTLDGHPGAPWTLVVAIPEQELLASAVGRLWALTGVAALILGMSLAWILRLGARFAGEIGALAEAAGAMGTVPALAVPATEVAEFGSLGQALLRAHEDIKEREELQRQLLRSQRLETLGTLASGIAHDVNNQLGTILGHIQLAQDSTSPQDLAQRLQRAKGAVERCATTTGALLAFGHRGRPQVRALDLNGLISETAEVLDRILGGRIEVQLDLAQDLPSLEGEAQQFEQVLMNLAVNARDAMPEGGVLTFCTRKAENRWLELTVRDTGLGIPPDILPRVFEPFFTTKPIGQGSGLGLAMVYGMVKAHGGTVSVESLVGKGTTFTLTFPEVEHAGQGPEGGVPENPASSLLGRRILLVEDEDDLREVLADALALAEAEVTAARDGDEAWELFLAGRFDCVVSDQRMPRCTGTELLARVREGGASTPFILVSGQDLEAHRSAWESDDALAFLPKPFTIAALTTQVRAMMMPLSAPGHGWNGGPSAANAASIES